MRIHLAVVGILIGCTVGYIVGDELFWRISMVILEPLEKIGVRFTLTDSTKNDSEEK